VRKYRYRSGDPWKNLDVVFVFCSLVFTVSLVLERLRTSECTKYE